MEKTSTMVAIVKAVHVKSVAERMTIENSFGFFKTLALQSSVHRPPYSLGIFTFAEMKDISEYVLSSYYRHYKLYQYAFTDLVRMDVEPAKSLLETCEGGFEALGLAVPEEEWKRKQEEAAAAAAEAKAAEEAEKAAAEEAEREARLKAEYEAAIPEEVTSKVEEALAKSMAAMKEELATKFQEQEEGLLAKIAALEAK